MKHILKKISIGGGGLFSKPKPQPPIYKPPAMGEMQYGASYSYSEILDLISDGPIEGLVNKFGQKVDGINLLQGIYLNDTAVAVSNNNFTSSQYTIYEAARLAAENFNMELDSTAGVDSFQRFFYELLQTSNRSSGGRISSLPSDDGDTIDNLEAEGWPNPSIFYIKERNATAYPFSNIPPIQKTDLVVYIRSFIKNREGGTKTFYSYLNNEIQSGYDDTNAAYRNDASPKVDSQSLFWTDENTTTNSKFFFGVKGGKIQVRVGHPRNSRLEEGNVFNSTVDHGQEFIDSGLDEIFDLYYANNSVNGNRYQKDLAFIALWTLGWWGEGQSRIDLFKNYISGLYDINGYGDNLAFIAVKVEENNSNLNKNILSADEIRGMRVVPYGTLYEWDLIARLEAFGVDMLDITCPEVDENGLLTGKMHGFVLFFFHLEEYVNGESVYQNGSNIVNGLNGKTYQIPLDIVDAFADIQSFRYAAMPRSGVINNSSPNGVLKFNYANILAEFKTGQEFQTPFKSFSRVFIDHIYDSELFGPFRASREATGNPNINGGQEYAPQRITNNSSMLLKEGTLLGATNTNLKIESGLPVKEGSDDIRQDARGTYRNYSSWTQNSLASWDEAALPVIHTIYNPNVESVFITLDVSNLKDTLMKEVKNVRQGGGEDNQDLDIGAKFPSILNINVETGTIGKKSDGSFGQIPHKKYNYRIVALIDSNTLIDIGNPDYISNGGREYIVELNTPSSHLNNLSTPFELPPTSNQKQQLLTADGESGIEAGSLDEGGIEKRYIKITKLSAETNSVLLSKIVSVKKVTEIINVDLTYPYSAIVATKLDSRAFSQIPTRSFDCKLKKVKLPSNYFPVDSKGVDKRYYDTEDEFNDALPSQKSVYRGDWDGSFHNELKWTDNPAWILYDLLTNSRYGMGSHVDETSINKWQLYKIGRFCDAVDDNGYFVGVTDGRGGKEPRFSCNVVFDQGQKIFDAINTIASIFRGRTFFSNSEINFVDDRPRSVIGLFTNENVKDGEFFYSNNRRDERFNTIEVGYKDRFDNFAPKIEVVEDEEDIKERGIFKKKIEGIGITSRAMARRAAQHQIFSKIKENQQVAFTAGLESLLCKPGDLIMIEDELKTNKANFGKVLDVDIENETIRLSNSFNSTINTGILTVYNPTGINSNADLNTYSQTDRQRYDSFTITGVGSAWVDYTGDYYFSGYTEGYSDIQTIGDPRFEEYALYTGSDQKYVYFETGVTGWMLASGNAINLYSGDLISELTGTQNLTDFNTGKIVEVDMGQADKRGATSYYPFSGFDLNSFVNFSRGVVSSEISGITPEQITVLNVTGSVVDKGFGTLVSGFDRPEILPFLKLGSPSKFEIRDASPFIYKVISMKEQAVNEYLVTATKYETGKFDYIDKNISIEQKANTYSYQVAQTVNGIEYEKLPVPTIDNVTTGVPDATSQTFTITGSWEAVDNTTGYGISLLLPNGQIISDSVETTGAEFTGLNQVGVFNFSVNALGNNAGNGRDAYFDSDYATSGIFVVYDELLTFSKSFLDKITIL